MANISIGSLTDGLIVGQIVLNNLAFFAHQNEVAIVDGMKTKILYVLPNTNMFIGIANHKTELQLQKKT